MKELLISVSHRLPGVVVADALPSPSSELLHSRFILEQALQNRPKARGADGALVAEPGVGDCLEILRSVIDHDAPTERHRFQEGRVGTSDLGGLHETIRVACQLAVPLAEDIPR